MNDTLAKLNYGQKLYGGNRFYRRPLCNTFLFRATAVPGIHKSHWRFGTGYSEPTHVYQWREYALVRELARELHGYRVNLHKHPKASLVDPWDDKPRARRGFGWKNFRKTRYVSHDARTNPR